MALSTFEAELIALLECSKTTIYLRRLMAELGYIQESPSRIGVDNQSVLAVSESLMIAWKNRHIPIRYFKIRELVRAKQIELYYVTSADNDSDLFTKQLAIESFAKHRSTILIEVPDMDFDAKVPVFSLVQPLVIVELIFQQTWA